MTRILQGPASLHTADPLYVTSFYAKRMLMEVTDHYLSIGINVNQLLSHSGGEPVPHLRVNVPMGRPVPFTG
jgi:hypothetical protein